MVRSDIKAAELLMDNLNQGIVFVDQAGIIQSCNMMAKEMTGIVIKSLSEHEEGCILPGDIVVIADNEVVKSGIIQIPPGKTPICPAPRNAVF